MWTVSSSGRASPDVAEVHGSIHHAQCVEPCTDEIWECSFDVTVDPATMRAVGELPSCPNCGGLARPNILMFGDWGWVPHRSQQQLDALTEWRRSHRKLAVIEIGAGTAVPTVRRQAELASAASGCADPDQHPRARGAARPWGVASGGRLGGAHSLGTTNCVTTAR